MLPDMPWIVLPSQVMKRYLVIVDTFEEEDDDNPIVTHQFWGNTAEEAEHVYDAHLESDRFLRDCLEKGKYAGRVKCTNDVYFEDTMTGKMWDVDEGAEGEADAEVPDESEDATEDEDADVAE